MHINSTHKNKDFHHTYLKSTFVTPQQYNFDFDLLQTYYNVIVLMKFNTH